MVSLVPCGQVNARDRTIILQFDNFRATRFDYQLQFNTPNDHMDVTTVMQSNDENEKLALDGFMTQFFSQLLQEVCFYRDPVGNIPQPNDNAIVHLYLDNAGVGFTFLMDCAGRTGLLMVGCSKHTPLN